jgi:hypothetical protein
MEGFLSIVAAVALGAIAVVMIARATSRAWLIAGWAYFVGGVCAGVSWVIFLLTDPFDPPVDFTAAGVATWFGAVGFFAIAVAMAATLVAIGRAGRRRFVVVFAAATLAIGTYEFWTSNWAARTASATDRCIDTGHDFGPRTRIQRMPPGVICDERGHEVFVPADGICWLALAGWSVFWSLLASYPIMGLGWALRRRPRLRPA